MSKSIILFIFLFWLSPNISTAQTWAWVQQLGSSSNESIAGLVIDEQENIYITGNFFNELTLGNATLNVKGESDIYIAKLDPNGEVLWAKSAGGAFPDLVEDMAIDAVGNIYCLGSYFVLADFEDTTLRDAHGPKAIFISKYDSDGNLLWVKDIEGTIFKSITAMAINEEQQLTLTGYFQDSLFIADTVLVAQGQTDLFVTQYNQQGEFQWINSLATTNEYIPVDIAFNSNSEIVIAGKFKGQAIFANDTIKTNTADFDVFVAQFDADGNPQWGRKAGGVHEDACSALGIDGEDNIFLTGQFFGVLKLSDSIRIQTEGFNDNAYLLKYDKTGKALFAQSIGNTEKNENGRALLVSERAVYLAGSFQEEMTIGANQLKGEASTFNGFVVSFELDGTVDWARAIPCTDFLLIDHLVQKGEKVFMAGGLLGEAQFDESLLKSESNYDLIVGLLNNTLTNTYFPFKETSFQVFPNPTRGVLNIKTDLLNYDVQVFDPFGKLIFSESIWQLDRSNISQIDFNAQGSGVYFLVLKDEKGSVVGSKKLVVQK